MSKRILITGGTGFIGHVLCRQLLARDYELTVFSRQAPETVKSSCGRVEAVSDLQQLVPTRDTMPLSILPVKASRTSDGLRLASRNCETAVSV